MCHTFQELHQLENAEGFFKALLKLRQGHRSLSEKGGQDMAHMVSDYLDSFSCTLLSPLKFYTMAKATHSDNAFPQWPTVSHLHIWQQGLQPQSILPCRYRLCFFQQETWYLHSRQKYNREEEYAQFAITQCFFRYIWSINHAFF